MALSKKIVMSNGLPLEYHRIALVSIEPNQKVTILRHSYLDEAARQYEKDWAAGKISDPTFPYVDHEYIHLPYEEAMEAMAGGAMEGSYALLKKHRPQFADATDC